MSGHHPGLREPKQSKRKLRLIQAQGHLSSLILAVPALGRVWNCHRLNCILTQQLSGHLSHLFITKAQYLEPSTYRRSLLQITIAAHERKTDSKQKQDSGGAEQSRHCSHGQEAEQEGWSMEGGALSRSRPAPAPNPAPLLTASQLQSLETQSPSKIPPSAHRALGTFLISAIPLSPHHHGSQFLILHIDTDRN